MARVTRGTDVPMRRAASRAEMRSAVSISLQTVPPPEVDRRPMGRSLAVSYGHTVDRSDSGRAGASARRAHERRRTRRVQQVRARHPRIGGLMLALGGEPAAERNWSRGAHAEELVGEALERRCRGEVAVMHDRRLPGTRANIDHIAIAPSGVWVIDTKRYSGKIEAVRGSGDQRLPAAPPALTCEAAQPKGPDGWRGHSRAGSGAGEPVPARVSGAYAWT